MDVTGGLSEAVKNLPVEARPLIAEIMDRLGALEAQTAKDTEAIADKVIAALVPQVQAVTQTLNAVADEVLTVVRRIDGATITVRLGEAH